MKIPRILITSGEPAGIGPDILIQAAQEPWPAELIVSADPQLLLTRAQQLNLKLNLSPFDEKKPATPHQPGHLKIMPITLNKACTAGELNAENASYVLKMLENAAKTVINKQVEALVTAPVHKGILNDAGFQFSGHTEFFAESAQVKTPVMLFVARSPFTAHAKNGELKVALVTTHLPLAKVAGAITTEQLEGIARTLYQALEVQFNLTRPVVLVCGLNPHAGESGHLGKEEIRLISPVIEKLRQEQMNFIGPLPADTIFTEKYLQKADAILAMYHDQALPAVKCLGFNKAVNLTLGLPFIRTSVDHGTALDLAGSGKADAASLKAAIRLAMELALKQR